MQQTARAAEITRQLLAFSRRQVLQPRVVNINDCVRSALPMLTRAVGVDVAIELQLDETVDHIFIDPEQLALVLMHLADNARNAMPQGGRLRISTAAPSQAAHRRRLPAMRHPHHRDTGVGMNEITLGHIFEPFFSTKNTTVTSGLGLSTVHGIVAQSKGRIECQSSPGKGTTFRIYLPIAADQPVSRATGEQWIPHPPRRRRPGRQQTPHALAPQGRILRRFCLQRRGGPDRLRTALLPRGRQRHS